MSINVNRGSPSVGSSQPPKASAKKLAPSPCRELYVCVVRDRGERGKMAKGIKEFEGEMGGQGRGKMHSEAEQQKYK